MFSALFAAVTAVLIKIGVADIDAKLATAIRTSVVFISTWGVVYVTRQSTDFATVLSRKSWIFLVLSGMATALSWFCYSYALQVGPASRVAPVDKLSVPLVIIAGALLLGEGLTWNKGIGGLLIVAGAIIIAVE